MSSREFRDHWEQEPPYPPEDFPVDDDLEDLVRMDGAHRDGIRCTSTVMNADETQVLGCVYLLSNDDRMYRTAEVTSHHGTDLSSVDATVAFWVRMSTWGDGFERDVRSGPPACAGVSRAVRRLGFWSSTRPTHEGMRR